MKQGGRPVRATGFTIIETLVVLAVSGALLLSAMLLINGRQNKTEFMVAINNLQQQLQLVINQTASGYYPNNGNVQCTGRPGNAPTLTALVGTDLGTNGSCAFVGNVLRFGYGNGADSSTTFTLFPLAGNRLKDADTEVQTLAEAHPVAIAPVSPTSTVPNSSAVYRLESGLNFVGGRTGTTGTFSPGTVGLAVVSSFAGYTGQRLDSKSGQFSLYGFCNTTIWNETAASTPYDVAKSINDSGGAACGGAGNAGYTPLTQYNLCFASGGTNQSGLITLGTTGGLAVSVQIKDGVKCGS
jgi:type II secretory pathway pseudopilin PulG